MAAVAAGARGEDKEMMSRTPSFVLCLLLTAFLIRLGAVVLLRDIDQGPTAGGSADDVEFDALAHSLAAGKGFARPDGRPTSFRAPGWPIFLPPLHPPARPPPPRRLLPRTPP